VELGRALGDAELPADRGVRQPAHRSARRSARARPRSARGPPPAPAPYPRPPPRRRRTERLRGRAAAPDETDQAHQEEVEGRSGVKRLHAHLWRHTVAQNALLKGAGEPRSRTSWVTRPTRWPAGTPTRSGRSSPPRTWPSTRWSEAFEPRGTEPLSLRRSRPGSRTKG
jgi:hypothetical protein